MKEDRKGRKAGRKEEKGGEDAEGCESPATQACRRFTRTQINGAGKGEIRYRGVKEGDREKWDEMLDYLPPGQSGSLHNYRFLF